MKKYVIGVLAMALIPCALAQSENECVRVLNKLIVRVEKEYPGFHDKVKDAAAYENFKRQLIASAASAEKGEGFNILTAYVNYFKDKHLVVVATNVETVGDQNRPQEAADVDLGGFRNYLATSRDSLEGIWTSGDYTIGLKKNQNGYAAFIIHSQNSSWKPSEIKFKLNPNGEADYYMGDHSREKDTYAALHNCILYFKNTSVAFVKEFPAPLLAKEKISREIDKLEGFFIEELSEKTLLLRISSFSPSFTARIENLMANNKPLLDSHDNLIIDVRGNGGGSDFSLRPLFPYLYTDPVRFQGGEYLVTQTLVDGLTHWAENEADQVKDADDIRYVKNALQRMKGHLGEFVPYSESGSFGFSKEDAVSRYPKRVAVLIDGGSASTTERFLLDAKQSKKVKVLGTPTAGAIDYVSQRKFELDSADYALYMPTIRAMRAREYPLDNIGIQPDIYMDKDIGDWIQYARTYLEN